MKVFVSYRTSKFAADEVLVAKVFYIQSAVFCYVFHSRIKYSHITLSKVQCHITLHNTAFVPCSIANGIYVSHTGSVAAFEVDLELWPGEECHEFGVS